MVIASVKEDADQGFVIVASIECGELANAGKSHGIAGGSANSCHLAGAAHEGAAGKFVGFVDKHCGRALVKKGGFCGRAAISG